MAAEILADTSVLIGLQRADESIIKLFSRYKNKLDISRITASELLYGSRNSREKKINTDFIKKISITEIDPEISLLSYKLIDKYALKNKFGIADSIIAATAISKKLSLWTENTKHFKQIKEVALFKPEPFILENGDI